MYILIKSTLEKNVGMFGLYVLCEFLQTKRVGYSNFHRVLGKFINNIIGQLIIIRLSLKRFLN